MHVASTPCDTVGPVGWACGTSLIALLAALRLSNLKCEHTRLGMTGPFKLTEGEPLHAVGLAKGSACPTAAAELHCKPLWSVHKALF